MNWPFISRRAYDLVANELAATKRELHRWQDIVAKQNWGHQIHDTLPVSVQPGQSEAEPIPEAQATEEEMQAEHQREQAELAARLRTRKSSVPAYLERMMGRRIAQRAAAAVAQPVKSKEQTRADVAARFERLKSETIKSLKSIQ